MAGFWPPDFAKPVGRGGYHTLTYVSNNLVVSIKRSDVIFHLISPLAVTLMLLKGLGLRIIAWTVTSHPSSIRDRSKRVNC